VEKWLAAAEPWLPPQPLLAALRHPEAERLGRAPRRLPLVREVMRLEERQRKTQVVPPWARMMLCRQRQRLSDRTPTGWPCFSAGTSEMVFRPAVRLHNTPHNRNGTLSELRRVEPCWAAALQRDLSERLGLLQSKRIGPQGGIQYFGAFRSPVLCLLEDASAAN
jgi:hypothetical protein